MMKLVSLEAVERERERERESYTLKIKSVTLFNSLTHTSNLINREVKNKVADATTLFIVNIKAMFIC